MHLIDARCRFLSAETRSRGPHIVLVAMSRGDLSVLMLTMWTIASFNHQLKLA